MSVSQQQRIPPLKTFYWLLLKGRDVFTVNGEALWRQSPFGEWHVSVFAALIFILTHLNTCRFPRLCRPELIFTELCMRHDMEALIRERMLSLWCLFSADVFTAPLTIISIIKWSGDIMRPIGIPTSTCDVIFGIKAFVKLVVLSQYGVLNSLWYVEESMTFCINLCGTRSMRVGEVHSYNAQILLLSVPLNKRVSEMWAPLAALRKPAGVQNRPPGMLYVFEHKTKNILTHAPHTHTLAFWHINKMRQRIS